MSDAQVHQLITRADEDGAMLFSWTGGEPLLRPEMTDYIEAIHARGIHQTLLTNGTLLNSSVLNKLPHDLLVLQVGFNEPWSTEVSARRTHSLILQHIENAVRMGFPVCVSITFDPLQIEMLPSLLQKMRDHYVRNVKIGLLLPIGRLEGIEYSTYAHNVFKSVNRLREIRKMASGMHIEFQYDCHPYSSLNPIPKRFLQCEAGLSQIYIDNNGDVYPCPLFKSQQEMNCGNYFSQSVSEVWNAPPMLALRNVREQQCEQCGVLCDVWCRALQYQLTKSVSGASVICPIKHRISI